MVVTVTVMVTVTVTVSFSVTDAVNQTWAVQISLCIIIIASVGKLG